MSLFYYPNRMQIFHSIFQKVDILGFPSDQPFPNFSIVTIQSLRLSLLHYKAQLLQSPLPTTMTHSESFN
jgi:hypothetical protein